MIASVPTLLLGLPLTVALLAVIFGRWARPVTVAAVLVTGAMVVLLLLASPETGRFGGPEAAVAGWTLTLTPSVRHLLLFMWGSLVVLFGLAVVWPSDRAFVPGALAATAVAGAAMMIEPAQYGMILLLAALALVMPMLVAGRPGAVAAAWQLFALFTLCVPLIFVADGLLASGEGASTLAGYAILLANLVVLAGFPLFIWASGVARSVSPPAGVFIFGVLQAALVAYIFGITNGFPAVRADPVFRLSIGWSGVLTALTAAFFMIRSRNWRELTAYAVLFDMGMLVLAVSAPPPAGLTIALAAVVARTVALLLLLTATQEGKSHPVVSNDLSARLVGYAAPVKTALQGLALLSLLGLPLTLGFAARWEQLTNIGLSGSLIVLSLLAMALGMVAVWRAWPFSETREAAANRAALLIGLVLLAGALIVGLFPQLLLEYAARMTGAS